MSKIVQAVAIAVGTKLSGDPNRAKRIQEAMARRAEEGMAAGLSDAEIHANMMAARKAILDADGIFND